MTEKEEKLEKVQGFEISKKMAKSLTDDAIFILGSLKRNGVVWFEIDDSPEQQVTAKQLKMVSAEGYFQMFLASSHKFFLVVDSEKFKIKL